MYTLGDEIEGGHENLIEDIRKRYGPLPVLQVVPTAHKYTVYSGAERKVFDAAPDEWLNFLAGAAFVYTDSFHAVLFSIKYKKPFLVYYAEEIRSARMLDLAARYKIEDAVVCSVQDAKERLCFDTVLDYDLIHENISSHVIKSIEYIKRVTS
jgi:hypothetical protein